MSMGTIYMREAQELARAYETDGAALELGSVVIQGIPVSDAKVSVPLATLNRHGLVSGATGTGKTKTLQMFAELLSDNGIPVVMADMKGDLSGMLSPGERTAAIERRIADTGIDWVPDGMPVEFLSAGDGGDGVPMRVTVDSFGPIMMSRVLGLNEIQTGVLGVVYIWAQEIGFPLNDIDDLIDVITHLNKTENRKELTSLGGMPPATASVLLRNLNNLRRQGGDLLFGAPEMDVLDLMQVEPNGRGLVSLFEFGGDSTGMRPVVFSVLLMWVLDKLYHSLPEAGDLAKPKLVVILDEAQELFRNASAPFLESVEHTVRLIRSKGVGIFFGTQNAADIPKVILGQLGMRIQHAVRAFTPDDARNLKRVAQTFPKSSVYDVAEALTSLGTGEALITVLSETGPPTPVAWTRLRPPRSMMGALRPSNIMAYSRDSALMDKYGERAQTFDPWKLKQMAVAAMPVRPSRFAPVS